MYKLLRSLMFILPPETTHHLALSLMQIGGIQPFYSALKLLFSVPTKPVEAFGLTFKNPVGLAAGYDKDSIAVRGLSILGFGHIEVGTVTPRSQAGNSKPRIFRLINDEALINRMGFPGRGMDYVKRQLSNFKKYPQPIILGLNLGINKDTPLEKSARDYISLIKGFTSLVDYLTINISSPNTMGLRRLQGREMLESLLGAIARERLKTTHVLPLLVKLSPDLNDDELEDALGVILDSGMDGIIATNTTVTRDGLRSKYRLETGGISGSPLKVLSETMLEKIVKQVNNRVPIISVGGIMGPEDAKRRLDMGATLVQIYTGLIYRGPGLIKDIVKSL